MSKVHFMSDKFFSVLFVSYLKSLIEDVVVGYVIRLGVYYADLRYKTWGSIF